MRHVIPKNVSSDGGIAGGSLKKRNTIEAIGYAAICLLFFKSFLFFVPLIPKIIAFMIVGVIPGVVMLVGISDQSAIEFFATKMRYVRRKDIIPYVIQTENIEEEPKNLIDKYLKKYENKGKKKEEKKEKYIRELEFIINDPSSSKRQVKKAEKKLKKEEKIQRAEEEKLKKIQQKKEKKEEKKQKRKKKSKKN